MFRRPFLLALLLLTGTLLTFQAAGAQTNLGNVRYTPPTRFGLVGYSFTPSTTKKEPVPPPDFSPAGILNGTDSHQSPTDSLSENQTGGEGITNASYFIPFGDSPASDASSIRPVAGEEISTVSPPILSGNGDVVPSNEGLLTETTTGPVVMTDPTPYPSNGVLYSSEPIITLPPQTSESPSLYPPSITENEPVDDFSLAKLDDSTLDSFFLLPPLNRKRFFTSGLVSMENIPNVKDLKSGMTTLKGEATFAIPVPDQDHPLLITPDFSWTDFTLPVSLQPALGKKIGLYSPGLNAEYLAPISDRFCLDAKVGVHWNSDFKASSSKALRLSGRGVGIWKMAEYSRFLLGAGYQDYSSWKVYPIVGIAWMPTDRCYIDAIFPAPKIGHKIDWVESLGGEASPYWLYLAGEFTREEWIVEPKPIDGGVIDGDAKLGYRDIRILGGLERRLAGDINWAIEGGVVLSRYLEINNLPSPLNEYNGEKKPKTSGIARLKILF